MWVIGQGGGTPSHVVTSNGEILHKGLEYRLNLIETESSVSVASMKGWNTITLTMHMKLGHGSR